jgi:DNA polymerase IIIc chi subunit
MLVQRERVRFQESTSQGEVKLAGESVLVAFYNGSSAETLNNFTEKAVINLKSVQIHTLPPSSTAAKFHSMRAYLQVQDWIKESELDPTLWGWKSETGQFVPVRTDMSPAPAELLAIIRCKCKTNCDNKQCSCRKHRLECSVACKECKGSSCSNCPPSDFQE